MRLLEFGRYSLSEIAYRVGYQNYRDFYRNFVKHVGSSFNSSPTCSNGSIGVSIYYPSTRRSTSEID
jgi:AraC-like DNA-binding protein